MTDPMQHLDDNFDRLFGEQLAGTTPPNKPEPLPTRDATPVAQWPTNEGVEL